MAPVIPPLLLAATLLAGRAEAAGYHFLRVEGITSTAPGQGVQGGVGASLFSDAARGWITFGAPGEAGPLVREGWLESRALGPVMGVVPPAFAPIVDPYRTPWLLPWTRLRLGGEAVTQRAFAADLSHHRIVNLLGFGATDPRVAWVGPSLGLGAHAAWWTGWRGAPEGVVATGMLTGEAGVGAGVTVRDSFWAQGHAVEHVDLFGEHAHNLRLAGAVGVGLARVGAPVGLEVTGRWDLGTDNAQGELASAWTARASLFWQLAPPYRTRIEERVEARVARAGADR